MAHHGLAVLVGIVMAVSVGVTIAWLVPKRESPQVVNPHGIEGVCAQSSTTVLINAEVVKNDRATGSSVAGGQNSSLLPVAVPECPDVYAEFFRLWDSSDFQGLRKLSGDIRRSEHVNPRGLVVCCFVEMVVVGDLLESRMCAKRLELWVRDQGQDVQSHLLPLVDSIVTIAEDEMKIHAKHGVGLDVLMKNANPDAVKKLLNGSVHPILSSVYSFPNRD